MKEFVIGAEIFTRLTRLFLGIGHWDYDLVIYSNRYYLVVSENNYESYAFFEIDELQVENFDYPLKLRLSTQFIQTFSSLAIKKLSEDIRFVLKGNIIEVIYADEVYVETLVISAIDENIIHRNQYIEEIELLEHINTMLKAASSYLQYIDIYQDFMFGYSEDKSIAVMYEDTPPLAYMYRITNPKLFYSLYGKLLTKDSIMFFSNSISFTFPIKLSTKELVVIQTGFFSIERLSTRDEQFLSLLRTVTTDGINLDITKEKVEHKLKYITSNVKNKEIKANSLVMITNDCKLNIQDFSRLFKSVPDILRAKIHNRIFYLKTNTLSYLISLYFEVLAEKENVPNGNSD